MPWGDPELLLSVLESLAEVPTGPDEWMVVLGGQDYPRWASGAFFARKFVQDDPVLEELDRRLRGRVQERAAAAGAVDLMERSRSSAIAAALPGEPAIPPTGAVPAPLT